MPTARSQSLSFVIHVVTIALLVILTSNSLRTPPQIQPRPYHYTPIAPLPRIVVHVSEQRSGGSNNSLAPARHGTPPPRSFRTFIPPATHPHPQIEMPATIDFDVPTLVADTSLIGDPLSKLRDGAFGDKKGKGIGNYPGDDGIGDTPGGKPGISGRIGEPTRAAQVIYRVEPEFSEDARKAKFQGMVVLMIEIGTDGKAHDLKVAVPAGLGLDQKAIEAVSKWRFRPALRGSAPIVSTARVEVYFHLL